MPLILGTNSIKDTGFDVDNSLRFNDGSSDHLLIAPSGAGNTKTWTWSAWVKRGALGTRQILFSGYDQSGGLGETIEFTSGDLLEYDLDKPGSDFTLTSSMVFRDPSAWLNIVFMKDTTQNSETNRAKCYVNGVQISLTENSSGYPTEDHTGYINAGGDYEHHVGSLTPSSTFFDGYMAEVVLLDGTSADATSFGEFDADSSIWKPKNVSGLTFGTNGFYLNVPGPSTGQNSNGLGGDSSGNGNHFASSGLSAEDQSTDTPTNNFATLNPLSQGSHQTGTFSNGNLEYESQNTGSSYPRGLSSIGVDSGKWYMEMKNLTSHVTMIGISNGKSSNHLFADFTNDIGYSTNGSRYVNGSGASYGDTYSINDIIGIALDLDNYKIYFSKNGTWQNSGDPTSGSTGTGAISVTNPSETGFYFFTVGDTSGSATPNVSCNFGSPAFSISSGNADGNGYGNFEYAVPSSYYSLNTKNLAEYG